MLLPMCKIPIKVSLRLGAKKMKMLTEECFTKEAGEKATPYRNAFAASYVFFVLASVRTLFIT
jgi:hypothetical protein